MLSCHGNVAHAKRRMAIQIAVRREVNADILVAWSATVSEGMLPNRFPDQAGNPRTKYSRRRWNRVTIRHVCFHENRSDHGPLVDGSNGWGPGAVGERGARKRRVQRTAGKTGRLNHEPVRDAKDRTDGRSKARFWDCQFGNRLKIGRERENRDAVACAVARLNPRKQKVAGRVESWTKGGVGIGATWSVVVLQYGSPRCKLIAPALRDSLPCLG